MINSEETKPASSDLLHSIGNLFMQSILLIVVRIYVCTRCTLIDGILYEVERISTSVEDKNERETTETHHEKSNKTKSIDRSHCSLCSDQREPNEKGKIRVRLN